MARRPRQAKADSEMPPLRDRIVDAMLGLLAERRYAEVGLADIAERAGVTLSDMRGEFNGRGAILAAFARRIDLAVLAGGNADPGSGARDRLFEVIMRRFDALGPYRAAVRSVADAARTDPRLVCLLRMVALGSQKWTLAAAGIRSEGCLGRIALEGTVLVHAEVLRVWLGDDDPGLSRTMAALDRALGRGERVMRFLSDMCSMLPRARRRQAGEGAAAG